jgi:hypothetical protein
LSSALTLVLSLREMGDDRGRILRLKFGEHLQPVVFVAGSETDQEVIHRCHLLACLDRPTTPTRAQR